MKRLFIDARFNDLSGLNRVSSLMTLAFIDLAGQHFSRIIVSTSSLSLYNKLKSNSNNSISVVRSRSSHPSYQAVLNYYNLFKSYYICYHFTFSFWSLFAKARIIYIHDALPFFRPKSFSILLYKYILRLYVLLPNTRIVSPSNSAASEVASVLHIPRSLIHVIYNGTSPLLPYAKSYLPQEKYFLCVGNLKGHKNLPLSINSFIEFLSSLPSGETCSLLIAGQKYDCDALSRPDLPPSIKFLGQVSDLELSSLYQNCLGLLHLSSHEGFGLPVLEALSFNKPVICQPLPVFKELFSSFPLYTSFDPLPRDVSRLIYSIYMSNNTSPSLSNTSSLLSRFRWDELSGQLFTVVASL